jgi:tetratricopeptide (TPR) repeat protein
MLIVLAGTPLFAAKRLALLEEVTERDPQLVGARKAAAVSYIQALEDHDSPTCHWAQRSACIDHVNKHILALARLQPESSTATELTARLLAAANRTGEARNLLSERCSSFAQPAGCWQLRITLARGEVSGPALREALQAYYTAACANPRACVTAASWLGTELAGRGDYLGALDYYGRAVRSGDESPTLWLAISHVARAAGQPRRANEALDRARRAAQADPELQGKIDQETRSTLAAAPPPK